MRKASFRKASVGAHLTTLSPNPTVIGLQGQCRLITDASVYFWRSLWVEEDPSHGRGEGNYFSEHRHDQFHSDGPALGIPPLTKSSHPNPIASRSATENAIQSLGEPLAIVGRSSTSVAAPAWIKLPVTSARP